MDWWSITLKSSRTSVMFAFALIIMISGVYPNYNILEINSGIKGCILSSVAHYYMRLSIAFSLSAIVSGSLCYIFMPIDKNKENHIILKTKTMKFCWFFLAVSFLSNYYSVLSVAQFFEKSSQPLINSMSKPLDHYICTEAQSKAD